MRHPHRKPASSGAGRLVTYASALLSICGSAVAAPWQGQEVVEKGTTHVRNPSTPMEAPTELQLEELWRVGGDTDAEGEFFGLITDIGVHPSGEVYLLDRQLSEVKAFSEDGEYLRTIGREGEGPGEFRRPAAVFFDPEGNIGVVQSRPSRLVMLTPDGVPIEPLSLPNPDDGGFRALQRGEYRGGSMVVAGMNFRRTDTGFERSNALVRIDSDGNEVARFHESSSTTNMARIVIREDGMGFPWTVGPEGNVYATLDRTWKVHVWAPDGQLLRVVELDYEPLMRTDEQIEERKKELSGAVRLRGRRGRRIDPVFEVSDRERDIEWLSVADDGNLWVLSSRGVRDLPPGVLGRFDVFDPNGRYIQNVALGGEGDFEEDRFVLASGRIFVIRDFAAAQRAMMGSELEDTDDTDFEEDPEPMAVICYKLDWTAMRAVAAPSSR